VPCPDFVGRNPRGDLHDDTELLSELVTNAVLHAGGVTTVRLRLVDQVLRLTVCDLAAAAPRIARTVLRDAEHGRGFALIDTLATRWGIDHDPPIIGKCVWLELSTTPAGAVR
jgi:anti-sigma regulatory factor (Ser/Thr protein kinase)